nr:PREDICTED: transcription factor PIF3-like isoform X2 [Daucus carota subsp. sativus]
MADDRILELSPETAGRYLETSAPQLVDWGEIQHLDDSVFEPQQDDLFLNHLHFLTFVSAPTPTPVADLLISAAAPTQQEEQCLMNMTRNEDMVLPADDNKQLSTQTKGISRPGFVASSSTTSDLKRKGKKVVHGERQNNKEVEYSRKGKGESNSSSAKKLRRTPNFSEKKRRVRINEQLKNLQELVKLNGKVQQLSILDAAITEIKLLQQEVQRDDDYGDPAGC